MKASQKLIALLVTFLATVLLFTVVPTAYSAKTQSNNSFRLMLEKAKSLHEEQMKNQKNSRSPVVQLTKKTKSRIITFTKELTNAEIASIESNYDVKFNKNNSRHARYVITPHNEKKLENLQEDTRVEEVVNNDIYNVSTQTIDWGLYKMNIPAAWNHPSPSTGSNIVIALIDTGVQFDHPDLAGAILPGGHDYVNDDADPTDDQGHGTLMAGAIAAANNTIGPLGVAYNAKILPFKVCGADAQCGAVAIADAIDDAVAANVDIINLSLGGSANALILQAVQDATDAGIIVVAAAGNENVEGCLYPAGYENVVCVGSTTNTDTKASFSNFGAPLDVVTPGVNVLSTAMGSGYAAVSGTSISTAYYSGAAAIMKSRLKAFCLVEPSNAVCSDLRSYTQLLLNEFSVRDIGIPGRDDQFGNGIVDLSQIFTDVTTTHTTPASQLRKSVIYSQSITFTNNNSYGVSLSACTITSKNQTRVQTVPVFTITQLSQGATVYSTPTDDIFYTTFDFSTPIPVAAGNTINFSYLYSISDETVANDMLSYSFVCTFDRTGTSTVEAYRASQTTLTSTAALPDTLGSVYFTFGKLKYGQTVPASQMRATDTVYLKNFNPANLRMTQFFLYDYVKKGTQGFTKTYKSSTSFTVRTNYLLTGKRKYAYVAEFQDKVSGVKIKKYFVFYTK